MFSVPAAFITGILGIIYDQKKILAILCTIIAALLLAFGFGLF